MVSCVVPDCHNYSEKTGEAVSYHKFPQDHRTKAWRDRVRRVDMPALENSHVCSEHFLPSCFRMDCLLGGRYEIAVQFELDDL